MVYEYKTNYQDFLAAQRLSRKASLRRRILYYMFTWLLPILGAIAAAIVVWDLILENSGLPSWGATLLILFGTWSILLPVSRHLRMKRLYRLMKNGRSEEDKVVLELTPTELISRIPDRSEGRFLRKAVLKFVEDDQVALIFMGPTKFLLIPKRFIPLDEWPQVRNWFSSCDDLAGDEPC